jgi:hypothetical protein
MGRLIRKVGPPTARFVVRRDGEVIAEMAVTMPSRRALRRAWVETFLADGYSYEMTRADEDSTVGYAFAEAPLDA